MPKLKNKTPKTTLKIFLLFFLPICIYGQPNVDYDKLKKKLKSEDKTALDSAYTKIKLANYLIYHDLGEATEYIDAVLDGIEQNDFVLPDTFHRHLLIKAWTHQGKQQFEEANLYVDQAMLVAKDNKSRDDKLELLMNKGALLLQTKDAGLVDFVEQQLLEVDTTLSKADYIMYTLLHQYKSRAYALEEDYERAIRTLLKVSDSKFLDKIPSYKYGVRSALSAYTSFLGDKETAVKQLENALQDELFKHQKKQAYYDLCQLKLESDSLASAIKYLDLFHELTPHTRVDRRDYHYLSAAIQKQNMKHALSTSHIDSALLLQDGIQNNQKLLDVILLKSKLCEKMKHKQGMAFCIHMLDSLMAADNRLATTLNSTRVSKVRMLNMFLQSDTSYARDFATYDSLNTALIQKKMDPDLVAALLDFDNDEQQYQINQLAQTNARKDTHLGVQSARLEYAFGSIFTMALIFGFIYFRNAKQKRETAQRAKEEIAEANKIVQEKRLQAEKAAAEKSRLAALALAERKRLQEKQNELKMRVSQIEQSNQELENQLNTSQNRSGFITINTRTKVHKIKIDQLMFVSAESEGTRFYLKDKNFLILVSLKAVAKLLPDYHFVRIFRSTVVNIEFIQAVNSKYIVLENGEELVMSRTYKEEVKRRVG